MFRPLLRMHLYLPSFTTPIIHSPLLHPTQEQEQLSALRQQHLSTPERTASDPTEPVASKVTDMSKEMRTRVDDIEKKSTSRADEIEGGFGGQEELEDRYATTSGEH